MTKERLRKYVTLRQEVLNLEARVREKEHEMVSLRSPSLEGLPTAKGKTSSPVEDAVASLVDLQAKYVRRLEVMYREQSAIEEAVASLSDSVERQLMRARYLDGQTWEEVCETIGYSWSQVHRIHARALQNIADK